MSDQARAQLEADESHGSSAKAERFQLRRPGRGRRAPAELQREFERKIVAASSNRSRRRRDLQLLLSRAESGIVWWDPGIDLTSEVVKKLDAAAPKPAAAQLQPQLPPLRHRPRRCSSDSGARRPGSSESG